MIFWDRKWVSTKGTHVNTFRAGENLLELAWVKESTPGSGIVVSSNTEEESIGFVISENGAEIGKQVEILFGEFRKSSISVQGVNPGAPITDISSDPINGIFEPGDSSGIIDSVELTSNTIKTVSDIVSFIFKKNGVTIYNSPSPDPNGGVETFTVSPNAVTSDTTFEAIVSDGTLQGSAQISFLFRYAYYYGVGAPGLTPAQVAALSKSVQDDTDNVELDFSPTNQVYYFAYPAAYGALTSILDDNQNETISDWTVTIANITNDFGEVASYRIYEFNNLTTQVNFTNTFIK